VRRIRRIFPALALVPTGTLVVGWYVLSPFDYDQLGAHVAAGARFVSNLAEAPATAAIP
jgi:peptidoglycan/LPS O-acetylase OafA/YrhL